MDNKFIEIKTTAQGTVLLSFQYIVGLIDIVSETSVEIPQLETPTAVSKIKIYFGAGSTVQTNAAQTRQVFHDAIEKLYSTNYTENVVELKWPDTIINDVVIII